MTAILLLALAACGGAGAPDNVVPVTNATDAVDTVIPYAAQVRAMADDAELPAPGSSLEAQAHSMGRTHANCVDFALTLLALLKQEHPEIQAREVAAALIPDSHGYDAHTLIEVYESGAWRLIDPLFGVVPHNTDGTVATAQDMQTAVRAKAWNAITYQFITPRGSDYVQHNYIDWPLYFVNRFSLDTGALITPVGAPDPTVLADYFEPLNGPLVYGAYTVQCPKGAPDISVTRDGVPATWACDAAYSITAIMVESTLITSAGLLIYTPRRFVFPWDGTCNVTSVCP
jgi:hypothetical protein